MKILIAMSGGVDSSVAASLLIRDSHAVEGFTFVTEEPDAQLADVRDARLAAERLGIPHRVLNIEREFKEAVKEYFVASYEAGLTPNPCVVCNREIKFGLVMRYAEKEGFDAVATGHYARTRTENGRTYLYEGKDKRKDQSYMLSCVPEEMLARAVFPLGEFTKDEIRTIAEELGISSAHKKDSQDICFIPDGDYASFIENYRGYSHVSGSYLSPDGSILGTHRGHMCYTIGQRRGLGIAMGRYMYVLERRAADNTVVIGDEDGLFKKELFTGKANLIGCDALPKEQIGVRIRYAHRGAAATVAETENGLHVTFDEAQRAITPGQFAVFTKEDSFGKRVLGGAVIL